MKQKTLKQTKLVGTNTSRKLGFMSTAILILMVAIFIGVAFGAVNFTMADTVACLFNECKNSSQGLIFWELRLPRVLMAMVAGGGLAVAGALLQNSTNNQLADPYLFGIVSGAGLGAVLIVALGIEWGEYGRAIGAMLGALLAVTLVVQVIIKNALHKPEHLILAGVAVSFMLAALMHFVLYIADPLAANRIIFWLMGSVATASLSTVMAVCCVIAIVITIVLLMRERVDAMLLGDEQAMSLGVDVRQVRFLLLIFTALMTAVIVAFCGGIGFVGLMIPHIARRFVGGATKSLIPACFLLGGGFLVIVDLIARVSLENQEMPLGVITSALGSVFFLLILKSRHPK